MTLINTVLGSIDTSELGQTLTHDHVFVGPAGSYKEFPELLDENVFDQVLDGLIKAKEAGFDTIVDASTNDLGRDIDLLVQTSQVSKVNVIACSGWWLDFPRYFEGQKELD